MQIHVPRLIRPLSALNYFLLSRLYNMVSHPSFLLDRSLRNLIPTLDTLVQFLMMSSLPVMPTALSNIQRIRANSFAESYDLTHIANVNNALKGPGISIIDLGFPDPDSHYLENLVLNLGKIHQHGPPIAHSSTRGWFWDVKPTKVSPGQYQARSEGKFNFPWHTDCSYESKPPQYFGLHVLHADRKGGGTLSILNADQVISKLEPDTQHLLSLPNFRFKVPLEYEKGNDAIVGSVISRNTEEPGQTRICFRPESIQPLTKDAEGALDQLNGLIGPRGDAGDTVINITPDHLPDNSIVLMDNARWLHSRNEICDEERHLRRIRWDRRQFGNEAETQATA